MREGDETGRLVDAQFCAHPAGLKIPGDMIEAVKGGVSYGFVIGDQDFSKFQKVEQMQAVLRREVGNGEGEGGKCDVIVYKERGHGFAVRPSREEKVEDEAAEETARQAVEWFRMYL